MTTHDIPFLLLALVFVIHDMALLRFNMMLLRKLDAITPEHLRPNSEVPQAEEVESLFHRDF